MHTYRLSQFLSDVICKGEKNEPGHFSATIPIRVFPD